MKARLPLILLSALLASFSSHHLTAADTDLGNVMYVGDSITHGVNTASYRWELHKIFADNGISYTPEGVKSGNLSGGVATGTIYGNQFFNNTHSSQASARAYEIAGRKQGGRFDNSNIQNWLGQRTTKNDNSTYTGETFTGNKTPDTFFMMIGTNDLLSDGNNSTLGDRIDDATQTLLGDIGTIVNSMSTANPNAKIVITTIPTWSQHSNGNSAATHQAVADYNTSLKAWSQGKTGVSVVDVNKGMIDVTSSTPFYGVSSMFNNPGTASGKDGLHPNAQGDLIIAGNIAQSMGYAGRTAGQARKGTNDMAVNFHGNNGTPIFNSLQDLTNAGFSTSNVAINNGKIDMGQAGSSQLNYTWSADSDLSNGFTFDFNLSLGDGASNGWNLANDLSVSVGNGSLYGTLNINEGYIKWGNSILYSADMSANNDNLRLAYVNGNDAEGLKSGYYLWLGDMLIGEALSGTNGSSNNGVNIRYDGTGNATISNIALDATGAYAPTSTGITNPNNAFISSGGKSDTTSPPQGIIDWKTSDFTHTVSNIAATASTVNARTYADTTTGKSGNILNLSVISGTNTNLYANSGNYTGDIWMTVSGGNSTSWVGAHGANGTLTGNVNVRFTDNFAGTTTVFGAVNATNVTGNIYLEFSAENATYTTFTGTNSASVVGSYATNIGGNVDIVINKGTFQKQIIGGQFYTPGANGVGKGKTIGGSTHIFVNGGTIQGDVIGGGLTGVISGNTGVTITGGSVAGNVYGAGKSVGAPDGEISTGKNSSVSITGGVIRGNIYGAGVGGTVKGDSSVTITGNTAVIHNGTTWSSISAGGTSGTVSGNSTVHIKDLASGNLATGFDKFAGNISGGINVTGVKTLVLDHVTVAAFNATLSNFDNINVINRTNTSLNGLGGASSLSIEAGSMLILNSTADIVTLFLGQNSSFSLQGFTADEVIVDITGASNYNLTLTNIPDDFSNIKFRNNGMLYDAAWSIDTQANTANVFAAVPEPGSASLGILGICLLLSKRQRRA